MTVRRSSLLVVPVILVGAVAVAAQSRTPAVTVHEASFHRIATVKVMPSYPAGALAQGVEGVVVTSVTSTREGRVEHVDVLESPSEDIAASVREALAQWNIPAPQPVSATTTYVARAKLTFYFQIRRGKGLVLYPDQVAGNEDVFAEWNRPARTAGPPAGPPPVRVMTRETSGALEIDDAEFTRRLADVGTVVIDVRDRELFAGSGAHPQARNIPADEVLTRARAELPASAKVVIDCSRTETFRCHAGADALTRRGFKDVAVYLP
jgi:TonB family protein